MKSVALLGRKLELGRQQGGDLTRGPPRIALDLDDQVFRAADQRRQRVLGQVERFAAAFDPQAERQQRLARPCVAAPPSGRDVLHLSRLSKLLYQEMVPLRSPLML